MSKVNGNTNYNLVWKPKVSVIVATYHRDKSLERALDSLINQSYESIEIIVIDDNAEYVWNEKVATIIQSISERNSQQIIYIKNEINKGSAETRNIGIRRASGEYITFLDDDDIYLPNKVKNQVEHMTKFKSDYSITDLDLYDENEKLIEKRKRTYIKKNSKGDLLRYHFMHHMTGTDTMMFKKEYLMNIGGFPLINIGDEFYLMHKAIEADGHFSYLPICDIKAYIHTETDGLSSGKGKINGENELYKYKKKHYKLFSLKSRRYINMRHCAVLAYAYLRMKQKRHFMYYCVKSFFSAPIYCISLVSTRK